MCFFPLPNTDYKSIAYRKGLHAFDCGKCPECLGKKSNSWALRAVMQSKISMNCCMITLTYDSFVYDKNGNIIGEQLHLRKVDKSDCQKFIKRLREYFHRKKNVDNIKYLLTAEYGKRTGRPHYHCILFGVKFDDLIFHKKSSRGNKIYRSPTLEKLWKHGICTVDSKNVNASIAKYCTKYCVKDSGNDDTFMLASHSLGLEQMLKEFNGHSYIIDGKEYPIPRIVWQAYITTKHNLNKKRFKFIHPQTGEILYSNPTYKYVNPTKDMYKGIQYRSRFGFVAVVPALHNRRYRGRKTKNFGEFFGERTKKILLQFENPFLLRKPYEIYTKEVDDIPYLVNKKARRLYRLYRDRDITYKSYIQYWRDKSNQRQEQPVETRITLLQDKRYHNFKTASRVWMRRSYESGYAQSVYRERPRFDTTYKHFIKDVFNAYLRRHLPVPPCHIRANDRKNEIKPSWIYFDEDNIVTNCVKKLPIFEKKVEQLKIL